MTDESPAITTKHLARNVPEDFGQCCERIRMMYFQSATQNQAPNYDRRYGFLFKTLSDEPLSQEETSRVGQELDEIQIRFLAIQKTLDKSVPAKPVYETLKSVQKSLVRALEKLEDPDRDRLVDDLSGGSDDKTIRRLGIKFDETQSLAEKVTITRRHLEEVADDLGPIVEFFDYKQGLVTKGNPSKYAMLYAVHALADLFSTMNTRGLRAAVNEFADDGRAGRRGRHHNARRYTGWFLDFVAQFFWQTVPEQLGPRTNLGFEDQVRKIAQRRNSDPDLYKLLHLEEVSVEHVLQFMKRADALK